MYEIVMVMCGLDDNFAPLKCFKQKYKGKIFHLIIIALFF